MIWTADTVMYHDVSMDKAYSGSTLIWCRTCPVRTRMHFVTQGEPIIKDTDYVIADGNLYNYLQPDLTMGVFSTAKIFHADADYPAVYDSLCEGYVTDLGAAFGLRMSERSSNVFRYGLAITPDNRESMTTYIGHDWRTPSGGDRHVIMKNNYGLQSYNNSTVGFNLFPLPTGLQYNKLFLYRIEYYYQE